MGGKRVLVYGLGVSGTAAARHLLAEGVEVVAVEDDAGQAGRAGAALGIDVVVTPDRAQLARLASQVDEIVVSPGLPARHVVFHLGDERRVMGEVELAWRQATMPIVAVTGTNGKTTVTTLVTAMLEASALRAVAAGNIGVALIDAVHSGADVVVAEVSSFQLALVHTFRPVVGAWLNFAEDHLDWHPALQDYRQAKARLWANAGPGDVAVVNADDEVVRAEAAAPQAAGATIVTFGRSDGDFTVSGGFLVSPDGHVVVELSDMPRHWPHDVANAAAATATATAAGATIAACGEVLRSFAGLPHRVELVGEAGGVRYYDDSKSTTPGSTLAALEGLSSAVLIAGGRNKGLDLSALRAAAPHLRGVVAIGEAASEVTDAFAGVRPTVEASSMEDAVRLAADMALPGDAVVLSPACASFDWYSSYGERGDDFARCVRAAGAGAPPTTGRGLGEKGPRR